MKNEIYSIECTGDACVGDEVLLSKAIFIGTYPNAEFSHNEIVMGKIIKDSYGSMKQQHTFTIETPDGYKFRIKGRNLYRNGTWRKPWPDESAREKVLNDKHNRGRVARADREQRIQAKFFGDNF